LDAGVCWMSVSSRAATPDRIAAALVELAGRMPESIVVDIGGGSGTRAVPLALQGCTVLVVDSSIDALAILRRRARDAGVAHLITGIQADAVDLADAVPHGKADLVLCHHLLETVEDPAAAVAGIGAALKPSGVASVLVAGRFAAVLAQAGAGRFGAAAAILADPAGRYGDSDPLIRRFDLEGLLALLLAGGLDVEALTGLGIVPGPVQGAGRAGARSASESTTEEPRLADLEAQLAVHRQLREIATDLHAVARLRAG